ncbi:amino acid adenylation domain-containing protein [Streptomyces sp. NPDC004284]|uniref:amino acid adenylation domain-containing protein n=1 Tax=Streptomyces sp. NPDC004284 TaxID=3364695 RepID=UPI00368ABBD3
MPTTTTTATDLPEDVPAEWGTHRVHELVARWAHRTPDAPAVTCGGEVLTYRDLDVRANRIAHRLRSLGLRLDDPVAVCLDRSPLLIVALLAVLKAGGGYLAVDPRDPLERRAALLADAGVRVLLTGPSDGAAGTEAEAGTYDALGVTVVRLDDATDGADDLAVGLPDEAGAGPDNLAYIAYTSGSTGRPKGVCVPHRAVVRLVSADFLRVDADDVFLQYAPVAFDASTLEIWTPLTAGGRLAVVPAGDWSPGELAALARREGVSVLWLTAGLFHQFVDAGSEDLPRLRYLVAGGDVLSPSHVDRVRAALPAVTVVNGYGPTENTTFTCCHPVTEAVGDGPVPIGRPIGGTEVYVLDEDLSPVPPGSTGELYAGGSGLARGYHAQAGLTAERFLPNPFSPVPGARMYRTGDLARVRDDGGLEFLGRADAQVKIRGHRVEPGEAEAAVERHPDVLRAAVVTQTYAGGDRRLAAFYESDFPLSATDLRGHLTDTLPSYLVPSYFRQVDALPLTASGKVDRAELAGRTAEERPELDNDYRAPATPLEARIAQLWADVLEIDRVGVDDDFFELGGHSLLATQITGQIATEFGVFVRARSFYEDPTVGGLARTVDAGRTA